VLGRLRNAGYNVIDRPRPRPRHAGVDDLSVNRGGIIVVAAADISLSQIIDVDWPTTFEMLCTRAAVGRFSAIVFVVYSPGSIAVSQQFFDEPAVVLDRVAIYQESIFVVGDLNIQLIRIEDRDADQLRLVIDCYGLVLHDTAPTHQLDGRLDVVISNNVNGRRTSVTVEDVGLSDHFLLRWKANATRTTLRPMMVSSRKWSHLDMGHFRSAISSSRLCQPDAWSTDFDEMAALYDDGLLNQLLPKRQACRDAKRLCRQLERAYAAAACRRVTGAASIHASSQDAAAVTATAAKEAWYNQRRLYRLLCRHKSAEFWHKRIDADQSDPRKLWRSVDASLGRGRIRASSAINVDAAPPTCSHSRQGVLFSTFYVICAVRRLPDKS